jgi:hypothetical protein
MRTVKCPLYATAANVASASIGSRACPAELEFHIWKQASIAVPDEVVRSLVDEFEHVSMMTVDAAGLGDQLTDEITR